MWNILSLQHLVEESIKMAVENINLECRSKILEIYSGNQSLSLHGEGEESKEKELSVESCHHLSSIPLSLTKVLQYSPHGFPSLQHISSQIPLSHSQHIHFFL